MASVRLPSILDKSELLLNGTRSAHGADISPIEMCGSRFCLFLPLDEAIASRAVFVIVSGSDGRTDGNAFGAS